MSDNLFGMLSAQGKGVRVTDQPRAAVDSVVAFGPFRLLTARHLLLEGEKPLKLSSRALEILMVLLERPGALVTREELVSRVWPDTFVEDGNLRVHMAALRRALGDGQAGNRYVATISGRGYRFVAPVSVAEETALAAQPPRLETARSRPVPLTRMIGRTEAIAALAAHLTERRFVTIVGAGGIGKTTLAVAVTDAVASTYKDKVAFVELALLADPTLVPGTVASVLELPTHSENPLTTLIAFLSKREMLLVLDNCEHVIEVVAMLVERVRESAPGVHILATSREPLRAVGEHVYRIPPLGIPPSSARLTAAEALSFPAVQLFVERAMAALDGFELNDANAPVVAEICRRLDGIALAIELAAGRVDAFGVRELAARLDDRFRILTGGRRTALPRQQTLSTTLDWSYQLLPEPERLVLRLLAVFAGRFTLDAVSAVITGTGSVVDRVANLVAKSLVTADIGGETVHYRLPETMRAYAAGKLAESGETQGFSRRHADYFRALFQYAELEWDQHPRADWLDAYGGQIDNVRVALDWAFSPDGDAEIGIALTIVAVPLWLQLSLMDECRRHVGRALVIAATQSPRDAHRDMKLNAAFGSVLVYTSMGAEARAAWTTALELAEGLDNVDYKLRSLWGLWVDSLNNGKFREALALARRFTGAAAKSVDQIDLLMGERMTGIALHFLGEQIKARQHIEGMLGRYVTPVAASHIVRFQFDQRVTAHAFRARILWLLGFPDEARRIVDAMISDALSIGHALSLCNALGQGACPVALFTGDLVAADRFLNMLLDHAARHSLDAWHAWALCFEGAVLIRRGQDAAGLQALRSVLDKGPELKALPRYLAIFGELAGALGRCGETPQALAAIDGALNRSERNEERWFLAELLRIKGELRLREGTPDSESSAEDCFRNSLDWARRQGTLSWELRTAISLARMRRERGDIAAARELLEPIYSRFTEGFQTADLQAAKALLDQLK